MIQRTYSATMWLGCLVAAVLAVTVAPAATAQGARSAEEIGAELGRVGIVGGFSLLGYTADFTGLPGVPSCCPQYKDGTGNALAVGISAETRVLPDLYGGLRLVYARYSGTLVADEMRLVTSGDDTTTATFRHTIDAAQPAISIEATVGYRAIAGLGLSAGLRGDLMMGGTYHQTEQIASPATIRYENDQRIRLVFDGSIPQERRLHLAIVAGARYDVPLNAGRTLLLSPEVQLWQGLGDIVEGITWKMRGIRFGAGLSFILRDADREPSPLAPGRVAEPATTPQTPAQPEEKKPETDPVDTRKPNNGPSSNSDIPNSHP